MLLLLATEEGGGALSNDPADLPWQSGEFEARFWWHVSVPDCMSVNTDGTGGMPDVTNPVGALINADAGNAGLTYQHPRLPQYSGAGIRRADHIEFPAGSLYLRNGALANINVGGMTLAFMVQMPTVLGSGQYGLVIGRDNPFDGASIYDADGDLVFRGVTVIEGPEDWASEYRRVVIASDVDGNARVMLDGEIVYEGETSVVSSNWERLMNYHPEALIRQKAFFVADCCFDSDEEMALLDRFMEFGP